MNIEKLKEVGIDYEAGLKRFSNKSALYEKHLIKFFFDTSFAELGTYISERNITEAFKCAHTLKGLSGNLSITSFYKQISVMVEALRNDDVASVDEMYNQLTKVYDSVRLSVL